MIRAVALLLTVLTGFSGLVYEVTWQKYLATLLGSHSEATAAVLALFLGGLSVGYSLFGRVSRRLTESGSPERVRGRLLRVYGLMELGIGLYAFVFPWPSSPPGASRSGFPSSSRGSPSPSTCCSPLS